ncbi:MAG: hypothetical protein NVSMB10_11110 [Steroidobacteraceae bacterium]
MTGVADASLRRRLPVAAVIVVFAALTIAMLVSIVLTFAFVVGRNDAAGSQ